jgi:hypothetical protein
MGSRSTNVHPISEEEQPKSSSHDTNICSLSCLSHHQSTKYIEVKGDDGAGRHGSVPSLKIKMGNWVVKRKQIK